jgi:hypothetical protein
VPRISADSEEGKSTQRYVTTAPIVLIICGPKPTSLYINVSDLLKTVNHISNPDVVNLLAVYISRLIFTLRFLEGGAGFSIKQISSEM